MVQVRGKRAVSWTALVVGAAAWGLGCETASTPSGVIRDIVPPTVKLTTTADTQQIAGGLGFSVHATDDLALNDVQLTYTGGFIGQTDTVFKNQTLTTFDQSVALTPKILNGAGGLITITARATDGAGNYSVDSIKIFLVNIDALKVTLLQPGTGAVASSGKNIPVSIQAVQHTSGVQRIGYIIVPRSAVTDPTQPPYDSIVNIGTLPDSMVFTDTLNVVATTGTFTVTGFAVDGGGRRAYSATVTVNVQSAANYTTPPTVTFTIAQRVEVNDSITVHATDPTGIAWIGFRVDTALSWTGPPAAAPVPLLFDTLNVGAGNLTDVTQQFALGLAALITKFPTSVLVRAYACDLAAARNCGYSQASIIVAGTAPLGNVGFTSPGPGPGYDTIVVVAGTTYPLPQGGHIADAIYNSNRRELYLTNDVLGRVEVFSLATNTFAPNGIATAGPTPWGIALWPADTLGHYRDSVVVADAGGTELSILGAATRLLMWRQALPNYLIEKYSIVLTPYIHAVITVYDVSDRPQYVATVCRVTSGSANCAADSIYAVYSTTPTVSSAGFFSGRATMRMEKLVNTVDTTQMFGHLFWEIGSTASNATGDTLRIEMIRPTFGQRRVTLTACRNVTLQLSTFGLGDQTFARNTGNFTHAFLGEGGNITTLYARVFGYSAKKALITPANSCTMGGAGGVPEVGEDDQDLGMSPGTQVSDFISNTGTRVLAVATNFNGLTNLVRASTDSIYYLDEGLRLWGTSFVGHGTPGMDMNYNHNFQPGGPCAPTCGGGSGNINSRIVFAASPDTSILAFDTYFFNQQARTPIRDPIIGPLRVAFDATSNQQYLFAITARGLVVVGLPAITNTNPQAPPVPQSVMGPSRVAPPKAALPKPVPTRVPARPRTLKP